MGRGNTPGRSGLHEEVVAILRCPSCGGTLTEQEAGVYCSKCARLFPSLNGVVRFVGADNYAGTFGFQWEKYGRTQLDTEKWHGSEKAFSQKTGFTPAELSGKLVLDVGCGMGRFAEVASRWGAQVVGVDLSTAAEVAAQNLIDRASVTIFQADVFSLPFAPESFDYIYSIGVLHHTPDCEQAFKVLPGLLKPGGSIAVWLYSAYNKWYRFSDVYRMFTTRMPVRWLHGLCQVARPLYYLHRGLRLLPVVGRPASAALHYVFPTSMNPDGDIRVLDTFDWYSPRYQSKQTYEQVFRWFESCGLELLRVLHEPIAVRGVRPFQTIPAERKDQQIMKLQGVF